MHKAVFMSNEKRFINGKLMNMNRYKMIAALTCFCIVTYVADAAVSNLNTTYEKPRPGKLSSKIDQLVLVDFEKTAFNPPRWLLKRFLCVEFIRIWLALCRAGGTHGTLFAARIQGSVPSLSTA